KLAGSTPARRTDNRPGRLVVRTQLSHSCNRGSTPLLVTAVQGWWAWEPGQPPKLMAIACGVRFLTPLLDWPGGGRADAQGSEPCAHHGAWECESPPGHLLRTD